MRVLLTVLYILMLFRPVIGATQYDILFEAFDARPLQVAEKRLLQTALAFQGYYSGLLDGKWGNNSQAAIERYSAEKFDVEPANMNMATLVLDFLADIEEQGWAFEYLPDFGFSLAMPMKNMGSPSRADALIRWRHISGNLVVEVFRHGVMPLRSYHARVGRNAALGTETYTLREANRWITSAEQRNSEIWYVRSEKFGGVWSSIAVTATPEQKNALNTIATSVTRGRSDDWRLPPGGYVAKIVDLTAAYFRERGRPTPDKANPEGSDTGPQSSGSGFNINRRGMILTNAHVVSECQQVTVGNHKMRVLWIAEDIDLAVLEPVDARRIQEVAEFALKPAELNSDVTIAGFPLQGILSGLNITRGTVSGMKGMAGDITKLQITAATQKGNSGGPVFDQAGAVVGVVVGKLNAAKLVDAIGDIPQNVNFAVRGEVAKAFLAANGVPYSYRDQSEPLSPSEIARRASAVTVFVECM